MDLDEGYSLTQDKGQSSEPESLSEKLKRLKKQRLVKELKRGASPQEKQQISLMTKSLIGDR